MGHPAQMVKELPSVLPGVSIREWVYGVFNSSVPGQPSAVKGLLAAADGEIIFYAKKGLEPFIAFSFPYTEILSVDADLETPARIIGQLKSGHHFELSLISRGDALAFMRYVTVHGYVPQKTST